MQSEPFNRHESDVSLGGTLFAQMLEHVVMHNADIISGHRIHATATGSDCDTADGAERDQLIAFLIAGLNGARSVDEIRDFTAIKLEPLAPDVKAVVDGELDRRRRFHVVDDWSPAPRRVWESVFLFGRRFEPLDYLGEPTVELRAREWFDQLHTLPDGGIRLSTGEQVHIRLTWSSYFGGVETASIPRLKREAAELMPTKIFEGREWAKKQELKGPDLDDDGYVLPEIIERQYAVSPLTGEAVFCYGTLGSASCKSDSGDPQSWRPVTDKAYTFITHWFLSRKEAENCLAQTALTLESVKASRQRTLQKKASNDGHKLAARNLQVRLMLLATAARLSDERKRSVEEALTELEPLLSRSKSSNIIRWTAGAELLFNRAMRETLADDQSAGAFVDGLFEYVLINSSEGENQDKAIALIDKLDSLHKNGNLRSLENRSATIEEVLVAVLLSTGENPGE
jgi:hypothetical protein